MAERNTRDPWFMCPRSRGDEALRLVCLPFAGGGASVFRDWAAALEPAGIELRPVQLPGRESRIREPLEDDLLGLARSVCDALTPYLDRPYALLGYSFGGLLAFELARELRRRRLPAPLALFIAATVAPQCPRRLPPMAGLPDAEFIAAVNERFEPRDAAWAHPELRELLTPILRNDIAAVESYAYAPEAPLGCPIHVHTGAADHVVPLADAQSWREQTSVAFELTTYPGGHFFDDAAADALIRSVVETLLGHARAAPAADGPA